MRPDPNNQRCHEESVLGSLHKRSSILPGRHFYIEEIVSMKRRLHYANKVYELIERVHCE
jgi:hypothetical protein